MRFLLLLACCVSFAARADMYKCVEEGNRVTYTSVQSKNCTRLSVGSSGNGANKPASSAANGKMATPSEFPRVEPNTQRARDDDRRRILDAELNAESKALESARQELAEQENAVDSKEKAASGSSISDAKRDVRLKTYRDKVALHERNIEALRKEIGNLR